ncbi:MAG: hypothetical protein LBH05_05770 [Deferribacteraceae bacterium]|jgi:hypothetical protein|nr:hypothetical protein [Deferribacteraceae bacterium]
MTGIVACSEFSKPNKVVAAFFQNLKQADYEKAHTFLNAPVFDDINTLLDGYFSTFEIADIKVTNQTGATAIVSADIMAVDFLQTIQGFIMTMPETLEDEGLSADDITDDALNALILREIQSPYALKKTRTVILNLNKTEGKWLIEADKSLNAALFLLEYNKESDNKDGETE